MSTPAKKSVKDKLKEVFQQIEVAFAHHPAPVQVVTPTPTPVVTPTPTKMDGSQEYTTNDGTVLSIDNLAVGGVVTIGGTPAPDGEYTLQDGTVLQVQSGFISYLTAAVEPDGDENIGIANLNTPEQFRKAMQKFIDTPPGAANVQDLALMVKALMEYNFGYELRQAQQQASQQAAINAYKTNFEAAGKAVKELVTVVTEFAEKPIEKTIEDKGIEPVTAWQRFQETRGSK